MELIEQIWARVGAEKPFLRDVGDVGVEWFRGPQGAVSQSDSGDAPLTVRSSGGLGYVPGRHRRAPW